MNKLPLGILLTAIFLMPIMGGAIPIDPIPLAGPEAIKAIFEGSAGAATMSQAILALLVAVAGLLAFARQRVWVLPQNRVLYLVMTLGVLFMVSTFFSQFKSHSGAATLYFLSLLLVFLVAIAVLGRIEGPKLAMAALASGTAIISLLGIREYATQIDPNWRIFSLWMNPNALAGMLVIGLFCGIGVSMATEDRLPKLLGGLSAVLAGCALWLSQSKGGLLAVGLGAVGMVLFLLVNRAGAKRAGSVLLALVVGIGFANMLMMAQRSKQATPAGAAAPAASRVLDGGASQEQSAGFRTLLWKGAIPLISAQPLGSGLGTYRFHSAKSGLTTITQTAHSSYLQLAVEAGALAALAFVGLGLLVLREMMRGSRSQPVELVLLKSGVLAAIVAAAVHHAVDSDLYSAGTGMGLMVLFAAGLLLSVDSTVPEFSPKPPRFALLAAMILVPIGMIWMGRIELSHGAFVAAASQQKAAEAIAILGGLESSAPNDPRTNMARLQVAMGQQATGAEQVSLLEKAIANGPTPMMYRTLARIQAKEGNLEGARSALQRGLGWDPNNLLILRQWLEIERANPAAAVPIAKRLLAVESTPYFQIRSLPEFVATQTYDARVYLAEQATDPKEKRDLLLPALDGYAEYAKVTVLKILQFVKSGGDSFAGESPSKAADIVETGRAALEAAKKVAQSEDAQRLAAAEAAFEAASRLLSESK
jgi:O-antigen ligase